MTLKIRNHKDFLAGMLIIGIAGAFLWQSRQYHMGSITDMGPSFFPVMLASILTLIGGVMALASITMVPGDNTEIKNWAWRPLVTVIGANMIFGVLLGGMTIVNLPPLGLVVAIFSLVLVASSAIKSFSVSESMVLASILSVFSYLVFIWMLRTPFLLFPQF